MKPIREVESGLLSAFCLFIGMQLALTALGIMHWLVAPVPPPEAVVRLTVLSLLEPGLLFVYLSIPGLRRTLTSFYLPIGIVWAAAGPILDPSIVEQLTISRERNRMARELHDVLAHTLSGVAVELEGVRTLLRLDLERANALLNHSLQAIREGLSETRRALKELRARLLDDLGLAVAVRTLAESYATRFDFAIELSIDPDVGEYGAEVQQCVYRIAQEALTNIAEHAQAQHAQLVLKQDRDRLRLIIRDDGCGFDVNGGAASEQYGLLGMRERAAMIGGALAVTSRVGKGTQISFAYGGNQ